MEKTTMPDNSIKVFRIVQYIQPWEIDDLSRQIEQHIKSFYYLPDHSKIIFDVTMNMDVVDWDNSKISPQYFIDKFNYLKIQLKQYFTVEFGFDKNIKGCTDKRRQAQFKIQDYIIWLDSDVYFSYLTLPYLISSVSHIQEDTFILSPEIIKYWDDSWDCLVHDKFLKESHNHRDYFDLYSFDTLVKDNKISLSKNDFIKFGGGWFNLMTTTVFEKIPLVEELGSYAPDDTYLSICGKSIIPQYILRGVVVSEIGKILLEDKNYIKPLLDIKIQNKQKISDIELHQLINKFYNESIFNNPQL